MAKLITSALFIAFIFIATASVSNCQLQIIGRGLTCSTPSPSPFFPRLSGANVRLSCDNGATTIASNTTNASGDFDINVNPAPASPANFPISCTVFVDVPPNCTIFNIFIFQRVRVLRSAFIVPLFGQPTRFQAGLFYG